MLRIDTHHHLIPPFYQQALRQKGIDAAGGRPLPEWSPEQSLATMTELGVGTAILSVSTPGTGFLDDPADAASLARDLNDYSADLVRRQPDRFGFFATLPLPHLEASVDEAIRSLDELHADGVVLLANANGSYLGAPGQDRLWAVLNERRAVVLIHPADLPAPPVENIPPFATDFLLDTTRAAYLLVRNGIKADYPDIRFVLSHGGGFLPYASHRMALAITADTGRSILDILDDFRDFYFDTALSSSPAALPTLLEFARPGHVFFGSDWPFAPVTAGHYFSAGLENHGGLTAMERDNIDRTNALALFPRLAGGALPEPVPTPLPARLRNNVRRRVMRVFTRAMNA